MNNYVIIVVVAVLVIVVLRRLQSSSASTVGLTATTPHTAEGVKQLFASGHPVRALKLVQEIAGGDPAKLQALIDELGVQVHIQGSGDLGARLSAMLDPAKDPQIQAFLLSGNKIEAIKRWRDLTGSGLKEAKDAVDRLADRPPI